MRYSHCFDKIPFLVKDNFKTNLDADAQLSVGDFYFRQIEKVGSFEDVAIKTDQSVLNDSSTIKMPVDLFSDFGLNAEKTVNFLSKVGNFIPELLHAMGLTIKPLNEVCQNESCCPYSSSDSTDTSQDQDRSNTGWKFSPDTVFYNGLQFSIQGKPQDILKALSEAPHGISKEDLIKTVWPDNEVNDETLRSHICSIRKCIKKTLQTSDDPVPHVGSGDTSGWKLNFAILKMNAEDNTA
ncbi:MAG: hypothetical protein CME32_20400 [Gimesia sp.]|nr:hypothetical protein [Gimesia sp.]